MDDMNRIVICRHCGRPEYYGEMKWFNGKCSCRACYRADYKDRTGELYVWDDLDGPAPTMDDYEKQGRENNHAKND